MNNRRGVFLTFDVEGPPFKEDFMNKKTLNALLKILRLLEKYGLKGLFFVTGSVAEDIGRCPEILELMRNHEIGYHSSSHSVRPMIFEYTDVESYAEAVEKSLERETSRIDPSTGEIVGEGGILSLREIFPDKNIGCFRAPFLCWSPPHLEALRRLGLKFDFSTDICQMPTSHKGITFYPRPIQVDSRASVLGLVDTVPNKRLFTGFLPSVMVKRICTVLMMHPAALAFQIPRYAYSEGKGCAPDPLLSKPRSKAGVASHLVSAELLFLELSLLQKNRIIRVTPQVKEGQRRLDSKKVDLNMVYTMSVWAPRQLFGYKPRFLFSHFHRFFASST